MNPPTAPAAKYQRGNHPVFAPAPFLSILLIHDRGLRFNRILKHAEDMTAAALLNFELGFETTAVPLDCSKACAK